MNECENCANRYNDYCFACDDGNQFKPLTNAEKIREMGDEELARWLACPVKRKDMFPNLAPYISPSFEDWLDWLEQEAES